MYSTMSQNLVQMVLTTDVTTHQLWLTIEYLGKQRYVCDTTRHITPFDYHG